MGSIESAEVLTMSQVVTAGVTNASYGVPGEVKTISNGVL
jgi:hypothetical protein